MNDLPPIRWQGTRIGATFGVGGLGCLLLSLIIGPGVIVAQLLAIERTGEGTLAVIATGLENLGWIFLLVGISLWVFTRQWN